MKWLVTGGCGFIGTRLIARLQTQGGHAIRVLDNLSVGRLEDLAKVTPHTVLEEVPAPFPAAGEPVQVWVGDIRDARDVGPAVQDADVIVHLAANTGVIPSVEDPMADCLANVVGTVQVLEAAREHGIGRFVLASSGAPLGEQTPPIHEEKVPRPVSPYGASKLAGEAYCNVYHACFGIQTVALRFGNVYGPGSYLKGSVVAKFIRQALAGETLTIFGDGKQTRDFIFIEDLIDALVLAANIEEGGELFQIATGGETTLNELTDILVAELRAAGIDPRVQNAAQRSGEVIRNYSDISKAQRVLGWSPKHTLDEGMKKTVEWFLSGR